MADTMERTTQALVENRSILGEAYCYLNSDGTVDAGYKPDKLGRYESADAAYAHFRPQAGGMYGHGAWNICYALEDYLTGRDDAR